MEDKKNTLAFNVINFNEAYEKPTYTFNKKGNFIEWGAKNKYPTQLLDLYNHNGSPTHKACINKKQHFISSQGFEDILEPALASFIASNMLQLELTKASLDYELFNGFSFEVTYTNGGDIASIKHIPFHKLRIGIETKEINFPYVWFSNDWSKINKEEFKPEGIRMFNPLIKQGKQVVYYSEYNPQTEGLYPIAPYAVGATLAYIELDYEIAKFHLNQAKQGYAPQFILNFATGIPTAEEQQDFAYAFARDFKGTTGNNIILTYSEGKEQAPEISTIASNDSDKRFTLLMDLIDNKIVMGSEIPPQLLILTPGKLGTTDDRKELMDEFQKSYVTPRQNVLEGVLNKILSNGGFTEKITLKQYNSL